VVGLSTPPPPPFFFFYPEVPLLPFTPFSLSPPPPQSLFVSIRFTNSGFFSSPLSPFFHHNLFLFRLPFSTFFFFPIQFPVPSSSPFLGPSPNYLHLLPSSSWCLLTAKVLTLFINIQCFLFFPSHPPLPPFLPPDFPPNRSKAFSNILSPPTLAFSPLLRIPTLSSLSVIPPPSPLQAGY